MPLDPSQYTDQERSAHEPILEIPAGSSCLEQESDIPYPVPMLPIVNTLELLGNAMYTLFL